LQFIEEHIGAPVTLIGVGPGREQIVWTDAGRSSIIGPKASTSTAA
jgi:adenylosuccinate synthase